MSDHDSYRSVESPPEGSAKLTVYLNEVSEIEVERLAELIGDLLVERGYARDGLVRSLVTAVGWTWPEDEHDLIRSLADDAAMILIPGEGGDENGDDA